MPGLRRAVQEAPCMSGRDIMVCRHGLVDAGCAASPARMGQGRRCLHVFNTENTKDSRSFTEKGNFALRAKRMELPLVRNLTTKPLSPETFVELRGTFVFSVLKCGATARNDAANGTLAQPPVLAAPLLQHKDTKPPGFLALLLFPAMAMERRL
jgi:hypothetical protein